MEILRELYKKYREQIMYLFFGGMTTLVNWLTYALLTNICDINKVVAETVAWSAAVIFAFLTNKLFVFNLKSTRNLAREFFSFLGARIFSGIIEIGGFALFVSVFGFNDWIVKIAISVIVIITNYVLSKFLIFKK